MSYEFVYVMCNIIFFFFFLQYWGLNSRPTSWTTPPALFFVKFFSRWAHRTICLGWLWTVILLISASWVARITGVSHQHLAFLGQDYSCEWMEPEYTILYCEQHITLYRDFQISYILYIAYLIFCKKYDNIIRSLYAPLYYDEICILKYKII
jgi:hypothetical protein